MSSIVATGERPFRWRGHAHDFYKVEPVLLLKDQEMPSVQ